MLYQISHQTSYLFDREVILKPHIIRLQPRSDNWQKLEDFSLLVSPPPQGISDYSDLDGNQLTKIWFESPTTQLKIQTLAKVETFQTNPFNYLVEPWATKLLIDYPNSLLTQLKPYLTPYSFLPDSIILELAQEIFQEVQADTSAFVFRLNQYIYENCKYIVRELGEPWQAGVTWKHKQGSCRDLVVLLMEVCRAVGLGARFVSGYQEGDPQQQQRDLHAWAEVYFPGAGWRGFDPTLGLAVRDRHIALAASAVPNYAAPVSGSIIPSNHQFAGKMNSEMKTQIEIQTL